MKRNDGVAPPPIVWLKYTSVEFVHHGLRQAAAARHQVRLTQAMPPRSINRSVSTGTTEHLVEQDDDGRLR